MSAISIGTRYEDAAIAYLRQRKVKTLQRNFSCKLGEIDLIAQDGNCLVFVEVRYRSYDQYGNAAESITHFKQRKIIRAAEFYLQTHNWAHNAACRFDVMAFSGALDAPQIEWIKDAFDA